jgi:endonuclease/exonuclease/phosphatase (EEP) superfamily protein YafD
LLNQFSTFPFVHLTFGMLQITLLAVAWVLIVATVLPFVRREAWWIRVFDFPRTQITVLALAVTIILLLLYENDRWQGVTLAVLFVCTAYQVWELSAYTRLRRVQSLPNELNDNDRRVRIIAANVLMTNRNVKEYITMIQREEPDVVVLAEPDAYWEHSLRAIEGDYPYTIKCPLGNTYGLLLYSRLKLTEEEVRFRVEQDVPSFRAMLHLRTGDVVELHCLHPRPPRVGNDTIARDAELVLVAREVKDSPNPIIVTGDMNDVAWSHTTRLFLRISGLLDPRLGRAFCNTFHSEYWLFRWPLDHLFHSRAFRLVRLVRLEKTESDHFPVLVDLSFEPEVRKDQERPVADAEDFQEAAEKVEAAAEKTESPQLRGARVSLT